MKRHFTFVLIVVLVMTFAYGSIAHNIISGPRKPDVMCVTSTGSAYHPSEILGGSFDCSVERCFEFDLCREESRIYRCCFRFNNGECNCLCWEQYWCIR